MTSSEKALDMIGLIIYVFTSRKTLSRADMFEFSPHEKQSLLQSLFLSPLNYESRISISAGIFQRK